MDRVIRFSSGLTGRIRNFSAGDFHQLITRSGSTGSATADQMAELADRVWLETIDRGPYRFESDRPPFKTSILLGDRSHVLVQARILTDEFTGRPSVREIRPQCDSCTRFFDDLFDYAELEYRAWPASAPADDADAAAVAAWAAREQFANGQPCQTIMPDGAAVKWNLLTGDLLTGPLRESAELFGQSPQSDTAARIHSIDGLDMGGKKGRARLQAIMDWLCDPIRTDDYFWHLWSDIQDQECGPETEIPKVCQFSNCGASFGYGVSITDFIVPSPPSRSKRLRAGQSQGRT